MKPMPLKIRTWSKRKMHILPVGFRDKDSLPYLIVETDDKHLYGYIEDKDIKRLKAWCDDCLKKRNRS